MLDGHFGFSLDLPLRCVPGSPLLHIPVARRAAAATPTLRQLCQLPSTSPPSPLQLPTSLWLDKSTPPCAVSIKFFSFPPSCGKTSRRHHLPGLWQFYNMLCAKPQAPNATPSPQHNPPKSLPPPLYHVQTHTHACTCAEYTYMHTRITHVRAHA